MSKIDGSGNPRFYYIIFKVPVPITAWSAAPQITLWGVPGQRSEPGTGGLEADH